MTKPKIKLLYLEGKRRYHNLEIIQTAEELGFDIGEDIPSMIFDLVRYGGDGKEQYENHITAAQMRLRIFLSNIRVCLNEGDFTHAEKEFSAFIKELVETLTYPLEMYVDGKLPFNMLWFDKPNTIVFFRMERRDVDYLNEYLEIESGHTSIYRDYMHVTK